MRITVEKNTHLELMRDACSFTTDAESNATLKTMYKCEHSPIRTQMFTIRMYDIYTFVSVHFVRHKVWAEHFVKSNRDDRTSYSGDEGRKQPVNHMIFCNAQSLIAMSRKRLCSQAHSSTIGVMRKIKEEVRKIDPDLAERMVRDCEYRNGCYEIKSCGYWEKKCQSTQK